MNIKMLVMDVDGTLTDGHVYMGQSGEIMKAFDIKDGYAIAHLLPQNDILPVIITGRRSEIVARRAAELKITQLYQGIEDKLSLLRKIVREHRLQPEQIAYIGDDLNDLACMRYCGHSACPADAVDEVLSTVDYVCTHSGGRGAVREYIAYLLKNKQITRRCLNHDERNLP